MNENDGTTTAEPGQCDWTFRIDFRHEDDGGWSVRVFDGEHEIETQDDRYRGILATAGRLLMGATLG